MYTKEAVAGLVVSQVGLKNVHACINESEKQSLMYVLLQRWDSTLLYIGMDDF